MPGNVISPNTSGGAGNALGAVVATLTANTLPKASGSSLADSRISDPGTGAVAIAAPSVSVKDSDSSHAITLTPGNESSNRALNFPVLGADATLMVTTAALTANKLTKSGSTSGHLSDANITDNGTTVTINSTIAATSTAVNFTTSKSSVSLDYIACMATA